MDNLCDLAKIRCVLPVGSQSKYSCCNSDYPKMANTFAVAVLALATYQQNQSYLCRITRVVHAIMLALVTFNSLAINFLDIFGVNFINVNDPLSYHP